MSIPPLFKSVFAVNSKPAVAGQVCSMSLLYDRSSSQFVSYSLSGGP
jgi:hypothetical protein